MSDPFDDARLRLERAGERIVELEAIINRFYADDPWNIQIDFDPERGKYVHKLVFAKRLDRRAKAAAAEALAAIRSSLDLATSAAARLNSPNKRLKCYFPFLRNPAEWDSFAVSKCRGVPKAVIDYFRTLRPHPGGDDRLYALSKARNDDEHWAIAPTAASHVAVAINSPGKPQRIVQVPEWPKGGIDELELFTTDEMTTDYGLYIVSGIEFEGSPHFGRDRVESVLKSLRAKAAAIIDETEGICRGIGLL